MSNDKQERPILFSGEMVRAILSGRKTQTRRTIKPRPNMFVYRGPELKCPYGREGDLLWVRETHRECDDEELGTCVEYKADGVRIKPEFPNESAGWKWAQNSLAMDAYKWRPSIFMPKWACRIWLKIKSVRIERLLEITESDARAEGAEPLQFWVCQTKKPYQSISYMGDAATRHFKAGFFALWDSINAKRGFGAGLNPWVWVVEFERVQP